MDIQRRQWNGDKHADSGYLVRRNHHWCSTPGLARNLGLPMRHLSQDSISTTRPEPLRKQPHSTAFGIHQATKVKHEQHKQRQ